MIVVLAVAFSLCSSARAAERKPNFVFIYTDNHRWDAMGVVQKVPTLYAIRTTTHKLVKYPGHPKWTEVFDLRADPYEIKNLASDATLTGKLDAQLTELIKAVNYTVPKVEKK